MRLPSGHSLRMQARFSLRRALNADVQLHVDVMNVIASGDRFIGERAGVDFGVLYGAAPDGWLRLGADYRF